MRIGILTSGGDCPGLNAGVAEAHARILAAGAVPVLVPDGYAGLQRGAFVAIDADRIALSARMGGSVLCSSRTNLGKDGALEQALVGLRSLDLDAVLVFGGDGSLRGVSRLADAGIIAAGVPKTIDADVGCTEETIGFATAVQTGCSAIEAIDDTRRSHRSSFVVEVMGRRSGLLAAAIARAADADGVVVPEHEWSVNDLRTRLSGSHGGLVVVAESAWSKDLGPQALGANQKPVVGGVVPVLESALMQLGLPRVRTVSLGHLLRGGSPVAADRILARRLAACAVSELLATRSCLAVVRDGRIKPVPVSEGFAPRRFLTADDLAELGSLLI